MNTLLVLTVIGRDRPGIVDRLSDVVALHGGSWQKSRMAKLAGQFAGVLEVAVDDRDAPRLRQALGALAGEGLTVQLADAVPPEPSVPARRLVVSVVGHDRPGIMRAMARALAARGVNVYELESSCAAAPMSGELMFAARAVVELPLDLGADEVRADLEALAGDMMVDFAVADDVPAA